MIGKPPLVGADFLTNMRDKSAAQVAATVDVRHSQNACRECRPLFGEAFERGSATRPKCLPREKPEWDSLLKKVALGERTNHTSRLYGQNSLLASPRVPVTGARAR
jgi:hypothetical protein